MSAFRRVSIWLWKRKFILLGAFLLLVFYLWIASSNPGPLAFQENDPSYYNRLSDGFLSGHLYLSTPPSPQLLELSDPYDPQLNEPYRLHDASLYKGRYYLYWGPVPTLLLYMPARILSLGGITDALAVALFAFVGSCYAIALLLYMTRRCLPKTPPWMLFLGTVGAVMGSALPFTLRRAFIYEVAICAAFALMFAGLYYLIRGVLEQPRRVRRFALASLLFGLAVGSRPTMVLPAMLPLIVLAAVLVRDRPLMRQTKLAISAALLGPLAFCGVALAAYNALRFGSITEFGTSYQLAGVRVGEKNPGDASYLSPGLWFYLLARAHITAAFPFFHLPPPPKSFPGTFPAGYEGIEPTGGLFTNVPITLLAIFPLMVFRRRKDRELRWLTTSLAALGIALILLLSYTLWGVTMRYEVEFAMLLLIPSIITWFALARARRHWVRRSAVAAGSIALAWSVLFGLAVGMTGYFNSLLSTQPGTYELLERATSPIATVITRIEGKPELVRVNPEGKFLSFPRNPGLEEVQVALKPKPTTFFIVAPRSSSYLFAAQVGELRWTTVKNLCANPSFDMSVRGWIGFSGNEKLSRAASTGLENSGALKVTIPDADLQGTVYSTSSGQKIREGTPVRTAVWMKGTRGADLEMQVLINNTDGTTSGSITHFTANGGWQRKTATVNVTLGKTGDVVQILALRRFAGGRDTFLVDDAEAAPLSSSRRVRVFDSESSRSRLVPLSEFGRGIDLHLKRGLNRVSMNTTHGWILLNAITVKN